jgi:hypothetical protein
LREFTLKDVVSQALFVGFYDLLETLDLASNLIAVKVLCGYSRKCRHNGCTSLYSLNSGFDKILFEEYTWVD